MREVITIKTPTLNDDGTGGRYATYSDVDYRGAVREESIAKELETGQTLYLKRYIVTLRNGGVAANITPEYKFTYRTKTLDILEERTTQNRAFREFICEAKTN